MEKSSKRGKIPQQDWPSIISRYEAGETLSSIARTYDCSPPAISYIVSRSRARNAAAEASAAGAAAPSEPQLVKGNPAEAPSPEAPVDTTGAEPRPLEIFPSAPVPAIEHPPSVSQQPDAGRASDQPAFRFDHGRDAPPQEENGAAVRPGQARSDLHRAGGGNGFGNATPQHGDQRRTLRLSMPHGDDGGPAGPEPQSARLAGGNPSGAAERNVPRPPAGEPSFGLPPRQPSGPFPPPTSREPNRMVAEPPRAREGGTFIDRDLRERVDGDIAAFLAAFDAALAGDTPESRAGLREATDRLLRAGARTRIELERLEARVPLGPRERTAHAGPAWRSR